MTFKLSIAAKLAFMVIALSISAAAAIGGITYTAAVERIRAGIEQDLSSLRDMRYETLLSYLESVEENVEVLSSSRSVQDALIDLSEGFQSLTGVYTVPSLLLQGAYTANDKAGAADVLARERAVMAKYAAAHQMHHDWFDLIVSDLGYYDVFLIDTLGNIVYTATKEKDFGTNLVNGPWSESGLANVFQGAMQNRVSENDLFADFAPYGPSEGDPAAFLAQPVYVDGNKIGAFAIQMPIDRINEIMFVRAGLGLTSETYLVGEDHLMRTQSRLTDEPTILQRLVLSTTSFSALNGLTGVEIVPDYRGIQVYSAFRPFKFLGSNWAILAEVDVSEKERPIVELRDRIIMTAMLGAAIIAILGMLFARTLTTPLVKLSEAMKAFGETKKKGNVPYTKRKDELGDISRVFDEVSGQVTDYLGQIEQAEKAVRDSAAQFEQMLDTSSVGIFIESFNNIILYANPKFAQMVKVEREQLVGMNTNEFMVDVNENAELLNEFETRGFIEDFEVQIQSSDETVLETVLSAYPLDYQDEPAIIEWLYNISERKQMEGELHHAKDAAEAATKAKSTFLASMSHEIRTPMNGVIGMVDILNQTQLDPEQRQMVQTIRDSGQSLLTIINDILDFSKIEAGKLELEDIDLSILDVVETAAQTLAPNAVKKGIKVVTYVDPRIPKFVKGDPVRIRQILINLGGNAIKFSENTDILIRAERMNYEGDHGATIKFSVIDRGPGISEEAQSRLFQEFSQTEVSTTRTHGGTGLGLAICKRLTDMMGGTIDVKSTLGKGSDFFATLTFPGSEKLADDVKSMSLEGLKVLLISPSQEQLQICRTYLSYWKSDVVVTEKIGACLSLVKDARNTDHPFDIVVVPDWPDLQAVVDLRKALVSDGFDVKPRVVAGADPRVPNSILGQDREITPMDVNPLRRAGFITAVSIAAGRASPEVYTAEDVEDLKGGRAPTVGEALEQGKLILLAEDNPVNQDVIRRQLTMLGYTCEIANDGKEAFEMWQEKPYCILLTDCHMPEWDGYQLTGAIRKSEVSTDKRSPIIAITANALQGEAERCLAAGMDDYMSKPVEMKVLKQTLVKWMGDGGVAAEAEDAEEVSEQSPQPLTSLSPSSASAGAPPIDDRMLKDMFGDDDAMFKEILQSFIDPTEAIIADLLAAFDARSAAEVKAQAHKLKSSSRSVGANELADTCLALETAGKEEDWDAIDQLAPQVEPLFNAVRNYVESL